MKAHMQKVFRDPFTHFLFFGSCAFLLFGTKNNSDVIKISDSYLRAQQVKFHQRFHQTPTSEETHSIIWNAIEEEALYLEGLKLNLGQHDPVVKKRIVQKMRFVLEGLSKPRQPSSLDLEDYLRDHLEEFTRPSRYTFRHAYYKNDQKLAEYLSGTQRSGEPQSEFDLVDLPPSDPFILGNDFELLTISEITSKFGYDFSSELVQYSERLDKKGDWFGPVRSRYGIHMVKLIELRKADSPVLKTVRGQVYSAWMKQELKNNRSKAIRSILSDYSIVYPQTLNTYKSPQLSR